jgi:DNA-binding CsgD family transcriptional regulator
LDGVTALVEQSLLRQVAGPGDEPRYLMLETVREYGQEQLATSGESEEIGRRHATYFLSLAELAEPGLFGPEQVSWFDRLEGEHANLRAALAWGLAHDPDLAMRLGGALPQFWRIRGHACEGRRWLEQTLAVGEGTPAARAKALLAASLVRFTQGDYAGAMGLAEEARDRFERLGDRHGLAAALRVIGHGHVGLAQEVAPPEQAWFARAQTAFEEQRALCEELGNRHGVALAIFGLGHLALSRGEDARAAECFEEALPLFEAAGDRRGIYLAVTHLGQVRARQGDDARAAAMFARALAVSWELGDRWAISELLVEVAWLAVRAERPEAAARLLGAAATLRAADGLPLAVGERADHESAVTAARATLGEETFAAALAAGRALSLEQAFAEAVEATAVPRSPTPSDAGGPSVPFGLTPREREVLCLLATGRTYQEVADALFVSFATVRTHVQHIYAKLGCDSRHAAATLARERGLC